MAGVVEGLEEHRNLLVDCVGLGQRVVEHPADVAVAGHDERAVVNAALGAEALGEPPAPGALLAGRLVARPRAHVLEALESRERSWLEQPGADEDVLVGTRLLEPGAFAAFKGLEDVCPRPGHKPTGEERAWSRRLAKRFGAEGRIDDRTFIVTGDGNVSGVFDYSLAKPDAVDKQVAVFFEPLDHSRHDVLIAFGWAMAEDLATKYAP